MFYFVTFMTGGGLFALHYFWQTELDILSGLATSKSFGAGVSWVFIIIGFPLVWYFSKQRFDAVEVKKIQYDQLVEVEIEIEGRIIKMKGLLDSGNQLYAPISKEPVMIVEAELLKDAFGKKAIEELLAISGGEEMDAQSVLMKRMKLIPYRVIGQAAPFLIALKPDTVRIFYQQQTFQAKKVLVGLQDQELSPEGAYQSIIHPKLVAGRSTEKLA